VLDQVPERGAGDAIGMMELFAPNVPSLAAVADELLIDMAREGGQLAARDELLIRYYVRTKQFIARRIRHYHLTWNEAEDAHQLAVFWILEALETFAIDSWGHPHKCCFRSFLHQVLAARLIDYVRKRWRRKRHLDCSAEALALVHGTDSLLKTPVPRQSLRSLLGEEPCERMQQEELAQYVWRIVSRLGARSRELWELTIHGGLALRDAANRLGISYDAAKRCRRKLIAALRRELTGCGMSL